MTPPNMESPFADLIAIQGEMVALSTHDCSPAECKKSIARNDQTHISIFVSIKLQCPSF